MATQALSLSTQNTVAKHGTESLGIGSFGRYSNVIPSIARNINKIAIPAITIFALSYIPGVVAPGVMYVGCTALCATACAIATGGLGTPACIAACAAACAPTIPISIIF